MSIAWKTGDTPGDLPRPEVLTFPEFLSPSLISGKSSGPAYEMKFLIDEVTANDVVAFCARQFDRDPHGEPDLDGAYRIVSLYSDTSEHDVYFRSKWYRRRKFRIRRYGPGDVVFLEQKNRRGDRVAKKREQVSTEELRDLGSLGRSQEAPGQWFHSTLMQRNLHPVCRISYQRVAFSGTGTDGPIRLTLDRDIRGEPIDRWTFASSGHGLPLLSGQVVLELKFRVNMPAVFKGLIADMSLCPTGVSKYRRCVDAWNLAKVRSEAKHA